MARFGKSDWLTLGLSALKAEGPEALRLEAITARAGRTRGSFYHHFDSVDAFVAGVIDAWAKRCAEDLVEAEDAAFDPAAALNVLSARIDPRQEAAIRRLAATTPALATAVAAVDRRRVDHLRRLKPDPAGDAAADYALVEYAALLGLQQLTALAAPERRDRLGRLIGDMVEAHWNE